MTEIRNAATIDAGAGVALVSDIVFQAFQTSIGMACSWDWVPYKPSEYQPEGDVLIGVLPLVGDLPIQLYVVFRPNIAEAISRAFFGFEISADSEDMLDMIGEIANVVAGEVSAQLQAKGIHEKLSLPTVIRGEDVEFPVSDDQEESWAKFRTPEGEMLFGVVSCNAQTHQIVEPIQFDDEMDLLRQITDVVRESTVETIKECCSFEDGAAVNSQAIPPVDAVIGILSFAGTAPWQMRMVFRYEEAERIATAFTGMLITAESEDIPDAIGEIVNVIAGDVSARLAERGVVAQLSVPTVMRGEQVELPVQKGVAVFRQLVATPVGAFWVEVLNEQ